MNELSNKLKAAVTRDPLRAGILGVLLVVLAFSVLRLTGGQSASPRAAVASLTHSGAGDVVRAAANNRAGPKSSDSPALMKWLTSPIELSERNLFAVRYERFPRDGSREKEHVVGATDGFWEEVAKSMTSQADERKRRQYLVENVRRQAATLKLQSTLMSGQQPRALINGEQVGEGDVVATASGETRSGDPGKSRVEFRVLKIEARRIIVEREGIKLEIQMN